MPVSNRTPARRTPLDLWARATLPVDLRVRGEAVPVRDVGHGFDPLGMSSDGVVTALAVTKFLYEQYFRVESTGHEHLPAHGPAVLAANHSGMLPLDGMMIWTDVVRHAPVPRSPRTVVDYFVARLPYVGTLFTRAGAFGGSRANVHELLSHGEMVLIFPEGTAGIGKGVQHRYELQRWSEGHAELAIRHGAPVIPVAAVGFEEAWPQIGRIDGVGVMGIPYLPIPATLLPMPVKITLRYGAPIPLHEQYGPDAAWDADVVREAAATVREAVDGLIAEERALRDGWFG